MPEASHGVIPSEPIFFLHSLLIIKCLKFDFHIGSQKYPSIITISNFITSPFIEFLHRSFQTLKQLVSEALSSQRTFITQDRHHSPFQFLSFHLYFFPF